MAYKASAETDAKIVELYRELKNGLKVAAMLGFNDRTVYRVLAQNGIDTRTRNQHLRRFKGELLDQLVADYKQGLSTKELCEKYLCARITILENLKQVGVSIRGLKPHMTQMEKEEAKKFYVSGLTLKQVAKKTGRSEGTITHMMNAEFPDIVRSGTVGPGSPHWGGGKTKSHGYVYVWVGDDDLMASMRGRYQNYVLEHRLVLARKLGRPLLPTETVHHIDGNRGNNAPENLELRQGKHGKHTAMVCLDCGSHNVGHRRLS